MTFLALTLCWLCATLALVGTIFGVVSDTSATLIIAMMAVNMIGLSYDY